jgi:hypothetical protein
MRSLRPGAGVILLLAFVGQPARSEPRWQDDPLWNDGKAEVSVYDARETKYGSPRDFRAHFIVVAEDLRADSLVKSDDTQAAGLTRVLKMNQVYDIPTGVYSYRQMASIFLRMKDLAPLKESVTSHEWCGNTFILLENRDGKGTLRTFSYFDGEAETRASLDLGDVVLYDSLPLVARTLPLRAGATRSIRMLPQLLGNRLPTSRVGQAKVSVAGPERVPGSKETTLAWKIEVQHERGADRLWVEQGAPNRLVLWEQSDGGMYRLRQSKRLAYWKLHDPGDESALDESPPRNAPSRGAPERNAPSRGAPERGSAGGPPR